MLQKAYPLIGRTLIAPHTHSFSIDCPDMAALARPGQFVHVRLPGFLLRRPISVCQITQDGLRIVVEERGAGTEEMARLGSGDLIDLLGPLGNGFLTEAPHRRAVLVGGGIGTPPLLPLAEHYHKAEVFWAFAVRTEPSSPRTLRRPAPP
jgi:dihydroorotate dehydrogenase electron transfer subunit